MLCKKRLGTARGGRKSLVHHSEIMFGEHEVRMNDLSDEAEVKLPKEVIHIIGFDTAEEVEKAFSVHSDGGEVMKLVYI